MTVLAPPVVSATEDAYYAAVLRSGPLAYWPLDDAPGTVTARDAMGGAGAAVMGGAVFGASNPWSAPRAATFDGTGVMVESVARTRPGPFTIEVWGRIASGDTHAAVVEFNASNVAAPSGTRTPTLAVDTGAYFLYSFNSSGLPQALYEPPTAHDGDWHHIVATFDGGALALYRDGTRRATVGPAASGWNGPAYWRIGNGVVDGFFTGDLCHVAVYGRALSASEVTQHYTGSTEPPPVGPGPAPCVRRAWLTLPNGRSMDLNGAGYFLTSLDLGAPTVRDVTQNRPDQHGIDDRTLYMGGRVVSVVVTALATAGARIDEVASAFGPYMVPDVRPVLHYVLDRGDNPERTLVLRASAYSWPVVGPTQRDVSLQWVAADPVARSATVQSATAWAGSSSGSGRSYSLVFDRSYPAGGGAAVPGTIQSAGDLAVRPVFTLYGPLSAGVVQITQAGATVGVLPMGAAARIDAGRWWTIDTAAHTATDDAGASVLPSLDWSALIWPVIGAGSAAVMTLAGDGTTHVTQAVATWQDGYLW
jgi:hypothetical protein